MGTTGWEDDRTVHPPERRGRPGMRAIPQLRRPARTDLLIDDRYACGPVIASGAEGVVRFGEDLRLGRPVAVKLLRPGAAADPAAVERLEREAHIAARLQHTNVIAVFDRGVSGDLPYVVMECLSGATWADELAWGPCDVTRARTAGLDVLAALDAAHARGIVHRDVKPANVLVSARPDGQLEGPLKLADFGSALLLDEPDDDAVLVGTPAYLSPERLVGERASPTSDVYSVGVLLYESLAGRRPFRAANPRALAMAIHGGDHVGLADAAEVPAAMAEVVERALAPVDRRWPTAAAMAAALRLVEP